MKAKEMFQNLGYKLDTQAEFGILYSKEILDKNTFGYVDSEMIYFDFEYTTIYFTNKDNVNFYLLKAINKQVEELGWNNEK